MHKTDVVRSFLGRYNVGNTVGALREILGDPTIAFDSIPSEQKEARFVLGFADALAFGTRMDALLTGRCLHGLCPQIGAALPFDITLLELCLMENTKDYLRQVEAFAQGGSLNQAVRLWLEIDLEHKRVETADVEKALDDLPLVQKRLLGLQLAFSSAWQDFWQERRGLFEALGRPEHSHAPLQRICPPDRWACIQGEVQSLGEGLPLIFCESFEGDWEGLIAPLSGRPALFLFADASRLGHALLQPAIRRALLEPGHALFVLDRYPADQIAAQPVFEDFKGPFLPVVLWDHPAYEARIPLVLEALGRLLAAPRATLGKETPDANWLYRLGRDVRFAWRSSRLGMTRIHYVINESVHAAWRDPHKGSLPAGAALGPPLPDLLGSILDRVGPLDLARRHPARGRRLRLAHVISQIIDGSHAPSRLLRTLIRNHDRDVFDLHVFVTECFVLRVDEYPVARVHSDPSSQRGPETIRAFQAAGVEVVVDDGVGDYWDTIHNLTRLIAEREIDVAVFHGPDFIHQVVARCSDVPLRVMFEHGSLPGRPGFDIAVASAESEENILQQRPRFEAMGTELVRNAHVVDARELWEQAPYPHSRFGVPEDALMVTTISNQLENHLSEKMCWAIGEILRRCPRAYYVPMGPVPDNSKVVKQLTSLDVGSRVKFLGSVPCPSQVARSMHIYLNEFPFGGGISLLDALAAGCPLVSMYDVAGPPQAKYVGIYYGMDRVVTSNDPADYVDLACRLLSDPAMHAEWREAAIRRYEAHTDVCGYVRRFEEIVRKGLDHRHRHGGRC